MKKFNLYSTLILIVFSVITLSCSKENTEDLNETQNIKTESKNYIPPTISDADIEIGCEGGCDEEGKACILIISTTTQIGECRCAGSCSFYMRQMGKSNYKEIKEEALEDFTYLIRKEYGLDEVGVRKIVFKEENDTEAAFFEFYLPDVKQVQTMLWLKTNSQNKSLGGKKIYSCAGSCDDESKTCRERFYMREGRVECTCEGSCSLTVYEEEEITPPRP
ncbi:hypothetical protein SAMN05444278_10885 [Psychroflexus salarius]|uniref:Lipoprotein n=1 Tax=Psychroflexus salarius TaxID=1155689 RepID=A0A1M4XDS1_9FLAO|nr:hypothetical protein [Psychroflexus salarius]SHE91426.1 hypothetical protein SAMN05444278_10885 [Psychroflexus salarius]